jgi:hypothetical protein
MPGNILITGVDDKRVGLKRREPEMLAKRRLLEIYKL